MLHSITVMLLLMLLVTSLSIVQSKALVKSNSVQLVEHSNPQMTDSNSRQFLWLTGVGRETSTPDFIRLVVMRFIYGMASSMGVEDRLEGIFNGAFVPPNADGDFFNFGDSDADGGEFDEAAFEGIFSDDVF